ncbi:MAG: galactokinase [Clostridia bacterium]|nr:galactokinase [Clostridia bacterium]
MSFNDIKSRMNYDNYDRVVSAAGRVNIIGEHVDYCGGKVLPAALSLKNTVYVKANGTDKINLSWTTLNEKVTLYVDKLDDYRDLKYGNYQAGSLFIWQKAGHKIVGCDMLMDCTVPFGSGLSSSAAIEVSTIVAMAALTGEAFDKADVALKAQQAEREYAGVNCGIMDQYASACGRAGHAILLDCKTLESEYVPLELGDFSLVIADCKKPHNLVESKYNERRAETEIALKTLKKKVAIDCLADLTVDVFEDVKGCLSGDILKRATHVVYECDRVRRTVAAMKTGDIGLIGALLNQSHSSLSKLYEVAGYELDALAAAAQSFDGCVGSRMTGGGFGGSTISLVKKGLEADFINHVTEKYFKATGYTPKFYDASVADGIVIEK